MAIADLQPRALEVAGSMGVDETFNILQGEGPESFGFDVSVEAAGYDASLQAVLDATRRGGTVWGPSRRQGFDLVFGAGPARADRIRFAALRAGAGRGMKAAEAPRKHRRTPAANDPCNDGAF